MLRNIIDFIGAAELQRNYYNRNNLPSGKNKKGYTSSNANERSGDL